MHKQWPHYVSTINDLSRDGCCRAVDSLKFDANAASLADKQQVQELTLELPSWTPI